MTDRKITQEKPFKVCFVCLGNICRSPTAEGVLQHLVNKRSLQPYFEIDSAGTSAYHTGESANTHIQRIANRHGVMLHSKARRFESVDLSRFDMVLAMDNENVSNIRQLDPGQRYDEKITLLRAFDPAMESREVPDPYTGGLEGFENVFGIIERSCKNLLDKLEKNIED
jgi:protein-tyrosine phosphatase